MLGVKKVEESLVYNDHGIFGEASKISNIPIAFASAMAAAIIPTVAQAVAAKDVAGARHKVYTSVKTIMFLSISAVPFTFKTLFFSSVTVIPSPPFSSTPSASAKSRD